MDHAFKLANVYSQFKSDSGGGNSRLDRITHCFLGSSPERSRNAPVVDMIDVRLMLGFSYGTQCGNDRFRIAPAIGKDESFLAPCEVNTSSYKPESAVLTSVI